MDSIGKREQYEQLAACSSITPHLPYTLTYSSKALYEMLNSYNTIYVKHNTSGQGRGVYKLAKMEANQYALHGYGIGGQPIQVVGDMDTITRALQPLQSIGHYYDYIVQEAIPSIGADGTPLIIRHHMQKLGEKWVVGGSLGVIAPSSSKDGVVNRSRKGTVITTDILLSEILQMPRNKLTAKKEELDALATLAVSCIGKEIADQELGVDFGITADGLIYIFEVNRQPEVKGFYQLDKNLYRKIMNHRGWMKRNNSMK